MCFFQNDSIIQDLKTPVFNMYVCNMSFNAMILSYTVIWVMGVKKYSNIFHSLEKNSAFTTKISFEIGFILLICYIVA